MKNILKTGLLLLIGISFSCTTKSQNTMYKNTLKAKKLIKQFNKQEHRLEVNDCEVVYNGKSFFLGNTLEEVEEILGKPDLNYYLAYAWKGVNIKINKERESTKIRSIYIYIYENYKEIIKPNKNIILINGAPITKDMNFGDFIDNSGFKFDDFSIHRSFNLYTENCGTRIVKNFDSNPIFNYSGGGHLQIRGDFNPKETFPVKHISIYESAKE